MTVREASGVEDWLGVLRLLWPAADISRGRPDSARSNGEAYVVLPSTRRPKVMAPLVPRGLVAEAVWRPTAADRRVESAARRLLAMAAGSRLGPVLFRGRVTIRQDDSSEGSIVKHLTEIVREPVTVSVSLGSVRANRKPVLQVHTIDGRLIGYAKVGISDLTAELVCAEAAALAGLARYSFREFRHPLPLWHGRWRGLEVLLVTALPRHAGRPSGPPAAAMRELASHAGTTRAAVADSSWLRRLAERFESVTDDGRRRQLLGLHDTFTARHGSTTLAFGAWHGDWGPWNMSWVDGISQLWDWERYQPKVPIGLDAVHYIALPALLRVGDSGLARTTLEGPAARAVSQVLGESEASPQITAVVDSYLLEIATRFATDAGVHYTRPTALAANWYLDVAAARLTPGAGGRAEPRREAC
jgi:hypothetical protein